jgi:hypothetical protein
MVFLTRFFPGRTVGKISWNVDVPTLFRAVEVLLVRVVATVIVQAVPDAFRYFAVAIYALHSVAACEREVIEGKRILPGGGPAIVDVVTLVVNRAAFELAGAFVVPHELVTPDRIEPERILQVDRVGERIEEHVRPGFRAKMTWIRIEAFG